MPLENNYYLTQFNTDMIEIIINEILNVINYKPYQQCGEIISDIVSSLFSSLIKNYDGNKEELLKVIIFNIEEKCKKLMNEKEK